MTRCRLVRMLTAMGVLIVLLAGCGRPALGAGGDTQGDEHAEHGGPIQPVKTTEADWRGVAGALGRMGTLWGETVYRVGFPRRDLTVTSRGVRIKAGFALGSYAAFVRYRDGETMVMGDLVVTEDELPKVTDALQHNGISQTAVHKHLLAHEPPVWWTHIHAEGREPVTIARAIRAALDVTATPPPVTPPPPPPLDLDTAGIDAALGAAGTNDGGIYKFSFARKETVTSHRRVLLPAMGVSTGLNFQPTGGRKAAINGDFVMTESEVQHVIQALRAGGIEIVELHNHALNDQPRLFYLHFWAVGDGVTLAKALRVAVDSHNVQPAS
ncbi:DUF1259 domain-containing protein [Kutzneria sp. CA-103260]|uniref:DUF1259 domain-containing protein n=1 Tax=Kutzneria sp. CA-103260 TaxID=2802641 RepID=UPI002012C0FB|nr:DUF1259 domain-containing protein [Kutzneria sp. CA-103260]